MRTTLVTATRGDGGQNEIGPEIFQALGVLRTEELLAVHRFDGAEQYFTRAIDFGYSFSIDEIDREMGTRRDRRRLRASHSRDPARRDRRLPVRRRRRRPASPGVDAADDRGVPRGRGSGTISGADSGRSASVAGEARVLHGSSSAGPDCAGADPRSAAHQRRPSSIRCWGALTANSASKAAACTSARARRSCCCCRARHSSRMYRLKDSVIGEPGVAPKDMFEGIDTTVLGLARLRRRAAAGGARVGARRPLRRSVELGHAGGRRNRDPAAAAQALVTGLAAVRDVARKPRDAIGSVRCGTIRDRLPAGAKGTAVPGRAAADPRHSPRGARGRRGRGAGTASQADRSSPATTDAARRHAARASSSPDSSADSRRVWRRRSRVAAR